MKFVNMIAKVMPTVLASTIINVLLTSCCCCETCPCCPKGPCPQRAFCDAKPRCCYRAHTGCIKMNDDDIYHPEGVY